MTTPAQSAYNFFTGAKGYHAFHNLVAGRPVSNNVRTKFNALKNNNKMKTPRNYKNSNYIFRGLSEKNSNSFKRNKQLTSKTFQSFSKSRLTASGYAKSKPKVILALSKGSFPHVIAGKNGFKTKFAFEQEVTLAPGILVNTNQKTKNGDYIIRYVSL
jgi:hypothetical protein